MEEHESPKPRSRRGWLALGAVGSLLAAFAFAPVSLADLAGGCDFAPTGSTPNCNGPLSPSTFEGGDGNLLVNTQGKTDWTNVAGLNAGIDLASGSGDNSFGQGTKEDSPNVTVVSGSIPPNKSDLIRFYEASEFILSNAHNYLYLAWERTNVLGSANMDFEINAATTPSLGTPGPHTINRSPGDLLVTFDFTNGGGRPTIGLDRWLVSATNPVVPGFATNTCLASNTFPCWGDNKTLDGTDSIAAVNNLDAVTDPIAPNAPRSLPALTFGETAIDLTKAGVFSAGTCSALGSTFLKSRASASFTAEVKDFVAPVPVNISNCGRIVIRKVTDPSPDPTNTTFSYSATGGLTPASFNLQNGQSQDYGSNVPAGTYSVTEADPTSLNFAFVSLDCSASSNTNGTTETVLGRTVTIQLLPGDTADCTYTNKLQLGAIKITKNSSKTGNGLAGATFSITGPNSYSNSVTSGSDGTVCVDSLPFGTYNVTETAAPTGYSIDNAGPQSISVNTSAKCSDATFAGGTATFTDTPKFDIQVNFRDGGSGATSATISCDNTTGTSSTATATGWDDTLTVTGALVTANPTVITCTITVDP